MRNDLQGLGISTRDLQRLTNLPVNYELIRVSQSWKNFGQKIISRLQGTEAATAIFMVVASAAVTYFLLNAFLVIFMSWLKIPSWLFFIFLTVGGSGLAQAFFYFTWKQKQKELAEKMTPTLHTLLYDVQRYNNAIQAIDINDQLEAAGNVDVRIREREQVLKALELTRLDLIRALSTERIMRENHQFIVNNSDLFVDNLAALSALQVQEKASEHGRLLNEALEIALDVQGEMRRLQGQK